MFKTALETFLRHGGEDAYKARVTPPLSHTVVKPPLGGWICTSVGYTGASHWEGMAATMVMGLWRWAMSWCTIKAGRVFWSSAPMVGSQVTR
jgi:hypothetical protein